MKVQVILLIFLVVLGSGGCTPSQTLTQEPQVLPLVTPEEIMPTQPPDSTLPLFSPTQGDDSQMTPTVPGLQHLIEKSKEDLAKRLSIAAAEINVAKAIEVVWPDTSLGCSQNGMAYLQVLTPGYLILLEYTNKQYEYHTDKNSYVIYCTNPTPPLPGASDSF